MHRNRSIHVIHLFDSLGIGGLEKGVITLANNTSADIRHTIICLRHSGQSATNLPTDVKVIEMHKPAGNSPGFIWKLAKEIRKQRPDVVHTRNWGGMDGIIAARLGGISRIVHGEHGWDLNDPFGQSKKRLLIRRSLSFGVREYVAVSCKISNWLKNDVKVNRPVTQIYNGVDTRLYSPEKKSNQLRSELKLRTDALLIGIVARLDPIKDHSTLLKAFATITDSFPEIHLVIIGDGPERERLTQLAGERVHLFGTRLDVPDIFPCLDIFVLSSLNEGISNTILEAMACGVPVVASRVGGNPELVCDNKEGLLFPAENVEALTNCLNFYLQNSDVRKQHGRNGRKRVIAEFSIESMASQYEGVWKRVARK